MARANGRSRRHYVDDGSRSGELGLFDEGKGGESGGVAAGGESGELGGETRRAADVNSPFPPERPPGDGELGRRTSGAVAQLGAIAQGATARVGRASLMRNLPPLRFRRYRRSPRECLPLGRGVLVE
jgi:hypothetical protein